MTTFDGWRGDDGSTVTSLKRGSDFPDQPLVAAGEVTA